MPSTTTARSRRWRPDWPCPVGATLAPLRRGGGDPTYRLTPDGALWKGVRTPEGPATLRVREHRAERVVDARAWGSGAEWVLDRLPRWLGADDDPTGFRPQHPQLESAWRRYGHVRLGATDLVMEALVPTIIEQKVTGQEAFGAFRRLVRRFGQRAPGPTDAVDLWVQPTPEQLRRIPSWEWLRLPVDGARSRPVQHACRVASSLERAGREEPAEFDRRVRTIPGVGVWTSAEVRARALGDPDAVSFGDYHVPGQIGTALLGRPVDDVELAELLEPWAGHRQRVQRLVSLAGLGRTERHGPRMAPRAHLPR